MNAMHDLLALLSSGLGLEIPSQTLTVPQVALRGVVVYLAGVTMVRLAPRRFMGRHTPFDLILGIILGAVLARAINGSAALLPTLVAGFLLVFLDRAMAAATFRWQRFRTWVEGERLLLVHEGRVRPAGLRRSHLSPEGLRAALRTRGRVREPEDVAEAWIERSGEVSVIPR